MLWWSSFLEKKGQQTTKKVDLRCAFPLTIIHDFLPCRNVFSKKIGMKTVWFSFWKCCRKSQIWYYAPLLYRKLWFSKINPIWACLWKLIFMFYFWKTCYSRDEGAHFRESCSWKFIYFCSHIWTKWMHKYQVAHLPKLHIYLVKIH